MTCPACCSPTTIRITPGRSPVLRQFDVPLFSTAGTLGCAALRETLRAQPDQCWPSVRHRRPRSPGVRGTARCPRAGRISPEGRAGATICITTDLGHVPADVQRQFRDTDLMILEANHDLECSGPALSGLPEAARLGQHGHLSNDATADALAACGDRAPGEVWLAHLSPTNQPARYRARRHQRPPPRAPGSAT